MDAKAAPPAPATKAAAGQAKGNAAAAGRKSPNTAKAGLAALSQGGIAKRLGKAWQRKAQVAAFVKDNEDGLESLRDKKGNVIIDAPTHAARLTPIRQLSEEEEVDHQTGATDEQANVAGETENAEQVRKSTNVGGLRRTFSKQCCRVMRDQHTVEAFDARSILKGCRFFRPCSCAFTRDLVMNGGWPLWRGEYYDSGAIIYNEGDVDTTMYVIRNGSAESFYKDWNREPINFGPGEYFGAAQALGVLSRRHESMRAKTSIHVLVISAPILAKLLKRTKEEDERIQGMEICNTPRSEGVNRTTSIGIPASMRKSSGSASMQYVFMEERRHFEREAVRLYLDLGNPRSTRGNVSGSGSSAARARRRTDDEPDAEATVEGLTDDKTTPSSSRRAVRRPGASGQVKANAEDLVQEAQLSTQRFARRVVNSLRGDVRRGYMMPHGESVHETKKKDRARRQSAQSVGAQPSDGQRGIATAWGAKATDSNVGIAVDGGSSAEEDDDVQIEESNKIEKTPIDLAQLPPLGLMNPAQKFLLLKQVQEQAKVLKSKQRKAARQARSSISSDQASATRPSTSGSTVLPSTASTIAPPISPNFPPVSSNFATPRVLSPSVPEMDEGADD